MNFLLVLHSIKLYEDEKQKKTREQGQQRQISPPHTFRCLKRHEWKASFSTNVVQTPFSNLRPAQTLGHCFCILPDLCVLGGTLQDCLHLE